MVNRIELSKKTFGDNIWNEVSSLLKILTEASYGCYVWSDEFTVVIEYDYSNWALANNLHYWLNTDEANNVDALRLKNMEN